MTRPVHEFDQDDIAVIDGVEYVKRYDEVPEDIGEYMMIDINDEEELESKGDDFQNGEILRFRGTYERAFNGEKLDKSNYSHFYEGEFILLRPLNRYRPYRVAGGTVVE